MGEITGKFWFAIQSSDDASSFGVEHEDVYVFHVCGCQAFQYDAHRADHLFCEDCYSSYEEHIQDMNANEVEVTTTWHVSESEIKYSFDVDSDLETVEQTVQTLEGIVGHYMDSYTILDEGNEIEYRYEVPKDVPETMLPLLARLCLGRQIAYCLHKKGSCSFSAEL